MTDSTGVIVGQVRDAETNAPVEDARVIVTWQELAIGARGVHLERRRIPAAVRPGGYYAVCGVPADDPVAGGAEAPGGARDSWSCACRRGAWCGATSCWPTPPRPSRRCPTTRRPAARSGCEGRPRCAA